MLQHRLHHARCLPGRHRCFSRPFSTIYYGTSLSALSVKAKARPITPKPIPIDASTGFIVNEASLTKVPGQWCDLLKGIAAAYKEACGPNLVGVYLRGSLPKGFFIPNVSDVDTFALVLEEGDALIVANKSSNGCEGNDAQSHDTAREDLASQGLQQQQKIATRLAGVIYQEYQHLLAFTKVEMRVLSVSHSCPASAVLQQHIAAAQQVRWPASESSDVSSSSSNNSRDCITASGASTHSTAAALLTPAMLPSIPAAFELKTQSVCLAGVDLPKLLPAAAAHPPAVQLLPGLAEDVAAARDEAATAALVVDLKRQISATKWALKRLIRCAFELVQQQSGVWTRDLYWCCHYASQYLPKLQQQLDQALELYVLLQQQQQQQPTLLLQESQQSILNGHHQEGLQQLLAAAWELVSSLSPQLETQFLKQMLTEEPGWLTKHIAGPIPASCCSAEQAELTRAEAPLPNNAQQQQQQQQWLWSAMQSKFEKLITRAGLTPPSAADAAAVDGLVELLGAKPPPIQIQIWGVVSAYDWRDEAAKAAACWHIQSVLFDQTPGSRGTQMAANTSDCIMQWQGRMAQFSNRLSSSSDSSSNSSSSSSRNHQHGTEHHAELFCCHPQPLVLQGLASGWPAVSGPEPWDLAWLSRQGFSGLVRAAPSLQFPFAEPQLLKLLQQVAGLAAAPSLEFNMSTADFVQRLQPTCPLPPLLYRPHEHYYMQAELSAELQQQLGLQELMHLISAATTKFAPSAATVTAGNCSTHSPDRLACQTSAKPCVADHVSANGLRSAQSSSGATPPPPCQNTEPVLQFSQAPRIWISPAGAVSPLHYDTSHSFLVQIRGYKRMVFFSPDQLHRLYCYPETHLLRRRSRVNVAAIDFNRFPLFRAAGALEVVLGPGDCVFFPSLWAHLTESLGEDPQSVAGCSMSVTFRH